MTNEESTPLPISCGDAGHAVVQQIALPALSRNEPQNPCAAPKPSDFLVSYAQNLEDIVLWRALKNVTEGFYVDVGANDPIVDSVTKLFYDKGWKGINIEPSEIEYNSLKADRPRDINLRLLAGSHTGTAEFFDFGAVIRGWSTMDASVAAEHVANGYAVTSTILPVKPLDDILQEHHAGNIHFLKIDVEGAERIVLEGLSLIRHRPWIIVLESMEPSRQVPCHEAWEPFLLARDYECVYADGLNRFYLAKEKRFLASSFVYPPNVFDQFSKAEFVRSQAELGQTRAKLAETQANLAAIQTKHQDSRTKLAANQANLAKTREKLEKAKEQLRKIKDHGPFRLRQLFRHPKAFLKEVFKVHKDGTPPPSPPMNHDRPNIENGHVDQKGTPFSLAWILRHPSKALRFIGRHPQKALRFFLRQPGKFMLGTRKLGRTAPPQTARADKPGRKPMAPPNRKPVETIAAKTLSPGTRPRMAFVAPPPPARTGVADYCAELLPHLAADYDIDLITDQRDACISGHQNVYPTAWLMENADHYDRILYQFGNSTFHAHMFAMLDSLPGVVVLHDFGLGDILQHIEWAKIGASKHAFKKALYYSHGYSAVVAAVETPQSAVATYPANWLCLRNAVGILVHSKHALDLARKWYGADAATFQMRAVPFPRCQKPLLTKAEARKALGIPLQDFVVCSFGLLGPTKLNALLLDAWKDSSQHTSASSRLVFVGQNPGSAYGNEIDKLISPMSMNVSITGYVSIEDYRRWIAAADVAVQLRSNSRGETSAANFDCLVHGVPLIVNAHGSSAEIPDEYVWKLPETFETFQLTALLEFSFTNKDKLNEKSHRASSYTKDHHSPKSVATQYKSAIENFYDKLKSDLSSFTDRPALPPQRTVFVDVTVVAREDLRTGIQRVTRAVMLELIKAPPADYRIEPVYEVDGVYCYARRYTLKALGVGCDLPAQEIIHCREGDFFLGLDWTGGHIRRGSPFLNNMKTAGCRMVFVVYDILPLINPAWFPKDSDLHHHNWLRDVLDLSHSVICISASVADDVRKWTAVNAPEAGNVVISHFHLGADIDNSAPTKGGVEIHAEILQSIASRSAFAMVGTVEPRKGHRQTLAAFEILWSRGVDINLVIVGKAGWCMDEFIDRLKTHPEAGRRLFWLPGISDELLLHIYRISCALIAASEGEGFGLPLIEAAQHCIPILARDIPVFHEVAGSHAFYFKGETAETFALEIEHWIALQKAGNAPPSNAMPYLTWEQSTKQLKSALGLNLMESSARSIGLPGQFLVMK